MPDTNGRARRSPPYIVYSIVIIGTIAMILSGFILFSNTDTESIMKAGIITTFASTIIVTLVGLQAKQTHDLVNSTASELREVTTKLAREEGKVIGIAQEAAMPPREVPPVVTKRANINEVRVGD